MGCLRLLFDHLAWIEHQFLSSIRDSRKAGSLWGMMRCGRSKEVRTPELIGQIKNFMDKDRCVSIERISAQFDVSVGTVYTIIREELKMRKICANFVPRVLREDQKERRCHDSREMVELINSDPAVLDALVTCDESWIYCYDPETKLDQLLWPRDQEFPVETCWLSQTQEGQTEQIHPQTFDDPFFLQHWHDLHPLGSHWTESQQGILCWGFKGVQEDIPWEEASSLQIGSVAFPPGQCTSPQLHPSHRLFDQDGHQDSSSASLYPDLAPCDFWLFPKLKEKLRGCRYERIEEMKEAVTKVIDTLTQEDFHGGLPEVVGTLQQMHCSRRRLLRRGLEFHVCTINKSAHTKKVWKLI